MSTDLIRQFEAARADPAAVDRVRPQFRFAKVKPTNNCNSKCITCSYWQHHYRDELTLDEVRRALAELRALGVEEVMFTGGEPTVRKDLVDMVRAARACGFAQLGITTNCLSLSAAKADELLAAGLCEFVLSFEGPNLHDEIRGVPGNTRKVMAVLKHLAAVRDKGTCPDIRIRLASTIMNRNLEDIPLVVDIAREHGATVLLNLIDDGTYFFRGTDRSLFEMDDAAAYDRFIDRLIAVKRAEPSLIANSLSSLEYARRYFSDPKQAQIPCYLGYIGCELDANGDVFSNCWGLPPVGNIRDASITEILTSDAYRRRCGAMYRKECAGCSCGYVLNLSMHPEARARDRAPGDGAGSRLGYAGERADVKA